MEKTRKVRDIESRIIKGIVLTGAREVADIIGVHESQISKWQRPQTKGDKSFIEKCACLLDAIEYDTPSDTLVIQGDEARALIQMLEHIRYPKRKTSKAATDEAQIKLDI